MIMSTLIPTPLIHACSEAPPCTGPCAPPMSHGAHGPPCGSTAERLHTEGGGFKHLLASNLREASHLYIYVMEAASALHCTALGEA